MIQLGPEVKGNLPARWAADLLDLGPPLFLVPIGRDWEDVQLADHDIWGCCEPAHYLVAATPES